MLGRLPIVDNSITADAKVRFNLVYYCVMLFIRVHCVSSSVAARRSGLRRLQLKHDRDSDEKRFLGSSSMG